MKIGERIKAINKKSRKRRAGRMKERIRDMELNVDDNTLFLAMEIENVMDETYSFKILLFLLLALVVAGLFVIADYTGMLV